VIYKKKLILLSTLAAALAIVYILSFVLDPQRWHDRAFAWLEPRLHSLADRIELSGPAGDAVLLRRNDIWFLSAWGNEYPVRQQRVQDLFAALSRRDVYTLRSTSLETRESLGLTVGSASRILVRGGIGLPLLDLLIGIGGALGRDVYMARADAREIYSGEDRFTFFTDSGPLFWLDFRLFAGGRTAAMVQQAEVTFAPDTSYILRRSGGAWVLQGDESADLLNPRVEAWLRAVLEAEGEDFSAQSPSVVEGSITLWFGDGTSRTVQIGPIEDEENHRRAAVSGSPLVYVLSQWTVDRLFREPSHFIR